MSLRVGLAGVTLLALIIAGAAVLLGGRSQSVVVEHPRIVATETVPGHGLVFMTLRSTREDGDLLIGATSDAAGDCGFHGPTTGAGADGAPFIDIAAGGETELGPQTAHIELLGLADALEIGQLVPITLIFAKAGEIRIKARVEALVPTAEIAKRTGLYEPAAGEPMPEITLRADPTSDRRLRIAVDAVGFTFDEAGVDGPHVPGRGHAHLYIDNAKIDRLYGPSYLTEPLAPGRHTVSLTLNTNDHRAYARDGEPVTVTITINIP